MSSLETDNLLENDIVRDDLNGSLPINEPLSSTAPVSLCPSLASTVLTETTPSVTCSTSSASTAPKVSIFPSDPPGEDEDETPNPASGFECHICLDIAKDAVVSLCGHLFCWPCLHQWLETRPTVQLCPVCKAGINKDKVVPLYGRGGNSESKDPRSKPAPPRPQGQRTEPETQAGFGTGTFGGWPGMIFGDGGSHLSFGIGAFPFAFFASAFNLNDGRPPPPEVGTPQHREERFLNIIFALASILFVLWLSVI